MSQCVHLQVSCSTAAEGRTRWTTRLREDGVSGSTEIFHEVDAFVPFSHETPLDGHLLAVLLHAATLNKTLRVHGPLSRGILRNVEELLLAWHCWMPGVYHKIDVVPDRVLDLRRGAEEDKAIALFSGGVDASFTAIRHARFLPERVRYPLDDVLMVHGFDVSLDNVGCFQRLGERVQPLLQDLGLKLHVIRTNSKQVTRAHWEHSFGLQAAACMHMLAGAFTHGLIGSSEPYDGLIIPWGSTPITDHLMSGDRMAVIHDGAAFSRTDKVAFLTAYPTACQTLKVCWEGSDQSGNCGTCEKCVRTQLNFLAAGVEAPPCFVKPLDLTQIKRIHLRNAAQVNELQSVLRYAESKGASGSWMSLLRKRIVAGIGDGRRKSFKHQFKRFVSRGRIRPVGVG